MKILEFTPKKIMDLWKYTSDKSDLIVSMSKKGTYMLDEVSSMIWERCNGINTVEALIDYVCSTYDMLNEKAEVTADIIELLSQWQKENMIILNYNPLHAFGEYDNEKLYTVPMSDVEVDVLLVLPPSPNPISKISGKIQQIFPLGIGYISSMLKKNGFKVQILSLWLNNMNEKSIKHIISKLNPTILGVSTMTDNFLNGVYIASLAKEVNPNIVTVFGGPHVTFEDYSSLLKHSEIDIVSRNEGEYQFIDLANYFINNTGSLKDIKGITYREDDAILRNPSHPLIKNLDDLPFPDRECTDLKTSIVGIQTSRGCPGGCIFCVASSMAGGRYRVRSAKNVVDEIEELYTLGARKFLFQDDTFTANIDRLYEILNLIKERNLDISWSAESRVDVIDKDPNIFKVMQEHGCHSLQFGIEAGSQESLDALKKDITIDQIHRAITATKEAGINPVCSMLIGHPYDTKKSIEISVQFAETLVSYGAFVLFAIVCPYPGTQIERRKEHFGIDIKDESFNNYHVANCFIETKYLTLKEIRNLYYDAMVRICS